MKTIKIAVEFFHRLQNRDKNQGDGSYTGEEFRNKYLTELDDKKMWDSEHREEFIELDFENVIRLGPSWANEVFAYFTQYAKPEEILQKIKISNISEVKMETIRNELSEGYKPSFKK